MTTPELPPGEGTITMVEEPDRRLHAMSWLFVLILQLKQFIVPLLALFIFGSGDRNDLWGLVAICILGVISIWQYYTYRFRIDVDSLIIRSGVLQRSLRQIPFARIHNVALHQSVLHRIFGVAEVRLESASGIKPEAEMRVLKLEDALALEALVRRGRNLSAGSSVAQISSAQEDAAGEVLHTMPVGELIRHGLISNRGMVVVAGAFAIMAQLNRDLIQSVLERWLRFLLLDVVGTYGKGHELLAIFTLLLLFVILLRAFSIVLAFLQYSGFRLEEHGRRLTLERGLLTRIRTSTPRRRIQSWTLTEGMLHRWFGRRTLEVGTAVLDNGSQGQPRSLREIAPVGTPEQCDALIRRLAPRIEWPVREWHRLHKHAVWRLLLPQLLIAAVLGVVAYAKFGVLGSVLVALWVLWSAYIAGQNTHHAGYAIDDTFIATQSGWWTRRWRFAELDKLQAVRLGQSPLDRRLGMANLLLDTAGGNAMGEPLRLRYLPETEARALHDRLTREIARRPLRW